MLRRLLPVLVVAVLLVGACGSGDKKSASELIDDEPSAAGESDDAATEKEYEDQFVFSLVADSDYAFNEEQARCAARKIIDEIGMQRLEEAGLNEEFLAGDSDAGTDLTDAEARAFVDALFDCGDMTQAFTADMTSDDEFFTPEAATCYADALVADDAFREMVADAVQDGGDVDLSGQNATRMTDLVMGCVDFGEMLVSGMEDGGAVFTPGERDCVRQGFNSNPDLRQVMADSMSAGGGGSIDAQLETVFRSVAISCGIPLNQ
jgi:hypothetical protein